MPLCGGVLASIYNYASLSVMTTDDELLYQCVVSIKMNDAMDDVLL